MKQDEITVWKYAPVMVRESPNSLPTYGDIPCGRFNEATGLFEHCVNPRGKAYAARKRQMYRSKKK